MGKRLTSNAGLSLTEAILSFGVMLMVMLGFMRVLLSTSLATKTNHEATQAKQCARQMMEVLASDSFSTVFVRYNNDRGDDPVGFNSPGVGFAIPGLTPVDGDADGLPGQVIFPTLAAAPGVLREDLEIPALGLPMDLNADGFVDDLDHSTDYAFLPVQIRIEWDGASGPGILEFETLIAND